MKSRLVLVPLLIIWTQITTPIVLNNSQGLIAMFIDGYSFGIDGTMFGLMLKIRKQLLEMVAGKKGIGVFHYNGRAYTLEQLSELEQQYNDTYNQSELKHLQKTLASVIRDLNVHLTIYAELAKGVKHYLLVFINESCQKHGRKSSVLQNWAKIKEGHEAQQLKKDLVDLRTALQFCYDMVHFLEDMCDSCPKAQSQFKELIEKAQQ
jgi:hypothetical protein